MSGDEWKEVADVPWTRKRPVDSQTDRMNDLWKNMDLMTPGYLSSLTYSVFIHVLTLSLPLSLHHPSLTHSLSPSSCSLFCSHTLSLPLLSPSPQTVTLCFIRSRCWQLREIEWNKPREWEKRLVLQIVARAKAFIFCRLWTLGTLRRVQSAPGYILWAGYCFISIATGYCLPHICLLVNVLFTKKMELSLEIWERMNSLSTA